MIKSQNDFKNWAEHVLTNPEFEASKDIDDLERALTWIRNQIREAAGINQ